MVDMSTARVVLFQSCSVTDDVHIQWMIGVTWRLDLETADLTWRQLT